MTVVHLMHGHVPACILFLSTIIFSNAETESTAESELDVTPTSKMIQFLVRDEVGTLGNALQIFSVSCA